MECQCAGCYPEREARRRFRENMARIAELELLRGRLLNKQDGEAKTSALEQCEELLRKARLGLLGREK